MKIAIVIVLLKFVSSIFAFALQCDQESKQFANLNRTLVFNADDNVRWVEQPAVQEIKTFVDKQIIEQLNHYSETSSSNVTERIRCIQRGVPSYSFGHVTNLPLAFCSKANGSSCVVGFEIERSGSAIPSIRPYLETFQKRGRSWVLMGEVGKSFTDLTFYVHPIKAGKSGQRWFFLYGTRIGRMRMAVAAYDGKSLREIWNISELTGTTVEAVFKDHVVLSGEVTNKKGRAEEFRERYNVVPAGLKLVKREVTKTY